MPVMPTLTPEELLAAAELTPSIDELERIGQECFAPWVDAAKNGDLSISYVRRLPGLKGYSAVFEKLRSPGLQVGVNSRDGQNHVIQNAFWQPINALWAKSKGRNVPTTKHATASGEINVEEYIAVTSHLLQSSDPYELTVGLAAATGRRSIEIVFIGKFSHAKATPDFLSAVPSDYLYQFQNPAKKRNYDQAASSRPKFASTALFRASDILKAWKALQSSNDVKVWVAQQTQKLRAAKWSKDSQIESHSAFNTDWASRLNTTTRDSYAGVLPGKIGAEGQKPQLSISCLRPAFAQLSFLRDCPKDKLGQPLGVSELLFKARILGHYIDDSPADADIRRSLSTLNYFDYRADTMPTYPPELNEKQVRPSCYESDRDWLNSLVEGLSQPETFRYLRRQHEALQAEVLELRQKVRALEQPSAPAAPTAIEEQLAQLTAQVAALAGSAQPSGQSKRVKQVAVPTVPTARLDHAPRKSEAQMKAHQWLDIVVGVVKDHNYQADGDVWKMWAFSKRMLKDLSSVSQRIVNEFWAEQEPELLALNEEWGLDSQHNKRRGMKQHDIFKDFDLQRPDELL
ncbi:MAG: protelomerase family protein [Phormidesmis sp.]